MMLTRSVPEGGLPWLAMPQGSQTLCAHDVRQPLYTSHHGLQHILNQTLHHMPD